MRELQDLRISRTLLQERLNAEHQRKLNEDREHRNKILRVQDSELEAHKRNHQFNCQSLCESILEANTDLDRMRTLWEQHLGTDGTNSSKKEISKVRQKQGKKAHRYSSVLVFFVVLAVALFVIRAATSRSSKLIASPIEATNDKQHPSLPPIVREDQTYTKYFKTPEFKTTGFVKSDRTSMQEGNQSTILETTENTPLAPEPAKNDIEQNKTVDSSQMKTDPSPTENVAQPKQRRAKRTRRFRPKDIISRLLRKHNK